MKIWSPLIKISLSLLPDFGCLGVTAGRSTTVGGMGFVKQAEGAEEPLLYLLAPRWR